MPYDGRLNARLNRTFRTKICLCGRSPNNVQSAVSEDKVERNKVLIDCEKCPQCGGSVNKTLYRDQTCFPQSRMVAVVSWEAKVELWSMEAAPHSRRSGGVHEFERTSPLKVG